jgi:protein-tyrosine-phosphatase
VLGDVRKKMRKKVVEWNLADPRGMSIEEIRLVGDKIAEMVRALAKDSSGAVS